MTPEFDLKKFFSKDGVSPEAFGLQYPCSKCELPTRFEEGLCLKCTEKLIAEIEPDEHESGGF